MLRERWRWRKKKQRFLGHPSISRSGRRDLIKEYTVFVYNLPRNLDQYGLKGIFQKAGKVTDSYIPARGSKRNAIRYGFVRFNSRKEAIKSVAILNNVIIRRYRIQVSIARYEKRDIQAKQGELKRSVQPTIQQEKWVWKRKEQRSPRRVIFSQENMTEAFNITGVTNPEFVEWLDRSLICRSEEPRDLCSLSSALSSNYGQCSKVRELSCYKFLLSFPTVSAMEEALSNYQELEVWFSEVKRWNIYEQPGVRRVWIEVFGVPPHGWLWENFVKIANIWGQLICLGKSIDRTDSFESMKVLIATDHFHRIEADILLHLDNAGYRLFVKEIGAGLQVNHNGVNINPSTKSSSVDVPGFEDVSDKSSSGMAKVSNDNINVVDHSTGVKGDDVVPATVDFQKISNAASNQGRPSGARLEDAHSDSKTKTVSFSHMGCSEEFTSPKGQEPPSLVNESPPTLTLMKPLELTEEVVTPLGKSGLVNTDESCPSAPPGFEDASISKREAAKDAKGNSARSENVEEESGESSGPPGFEAFKSAVSRRKQLFKDFKDIHVEKRLTRSQTKKARESGSSNQIPISRKSADNMSREGSLQANKSPETPESIVKLAKESLEMGELLGLKIIGKKEAAMKRLVSSLKNERKARLNSRKRTEQQS